MGYSLSTGVNNIFEVIAALAVIFWLVASVSSFLVEITSSLLNVRGEALRQFIVEMIQGEISKSFSPARGLAAPLKSFRRFYASAFSVLKVDAAQTHPFAGRFLAHSLYKSHEQPTLNRNTSNAAPSYLPAQMFAKILIDRLMTDVEFDPPVTLALAGPLPMETKGSEFISRLLKAAFAQGAVQCPGQAAPFDACDPLPLWLNSAAIRRAIVEKPRRPIRDWIMTWIWARDLAPGTTFCASAFRARLNYLQSSGEFPEQLSKLPKLTPITAKAWARELATMTNGAPSIIDDVLRLTKERFVELTPEPGETVEAALKRVAKDILMNAAIGERSAFLRWDNCRVQRIINRNRKHLPPTFADLPKLRMRSADAWASAVVSHFTSAPMAQTAGAKQYDPTVPNIIARLGLNRSPQQLVGNPPGGPPPPVKSLPPVLREALAPLAATAFYDFEAFEKLVIDWYESTMARATGWYRRYTHIWLLAAGFAIAVFFNINALRIATEIANNPSLRKAGYAAAVQIVATEEAGRGRASSIPQQLAFVEAVDEFCGAAGDGEKAVGARKSCELGRQQWAALAPLLLTSGEDNSVLLFALQNPASAMTCLPIAAKIEPKSQDACVNEDTKERSGPLTDEERDRLEVQRKQREVFVESTTAYCAAKSGNCTCSLGLTTRDAVTNCEKDLNIDRIWEDQLIFWNAGLARKIVDKLSDNCTDNCAEDTLNEEIPKARNDASYATEDVRTYLSTLPGVGPIADVATAEGWFDRFDTCIPSLQSPVKQTGKFSWSSFAINNLQWPVKSTSCFGTEIGLWLYRLLGWLTTALMVSLGAPFWFDLMQKLTNRRATGPKPDETPALQ